MVFKVASFQCSFFLRDLAGARAVVAGSSFPSFPGALAKLGARGKERGSPSSCRLSPPRAGRRAVVQGVYQAAGKGGCLCPRVPAPSTGMPSPCQPGCGTALGRCSAEPQPQSSVVSPLPCPAFLSHPRLAFRALNLPWALPAVLGLAVRCRPSAPPRQRREERPGPGGGGRPLCRGRAPLPLNAPCPARGSRAGKSLMSAGSLQRLAMEGRPFGALAALHPIPRGLGPSVPPRRRGEWVAGGGCPARAVLLVSL